MKYFATSTTSDNKRKRDTDTVERSDSKRSKQDIVDTTYTGNV